MGLALAVFLVLGLLVIFLLHPFETPLAFVVGLLAGGLLAVLRVCLLARTVAKATQLDAAAASRIMTRQYILQYLLTLVLLVAALFSRGAVGPVGTLLGVVSMQAGVLLLNITDAVRGKHKAAPQGSVPPAAPPNTPVDGAPKVPPVALPGSAPDAVPGATANPKDYE